MEQISLGEVLKSDITIMIFTEGTILKPKSWSGLYHFNSYLPIGRSVELIKDWQRQGANIIYCSSRKGKQALTISNLLIKFGFVGSNLYYRSKGEKYKDIVEKIQPTVLIEDDCESIGGEWQMCITNVAPQIREKIRSFPIKEFKGIDHLPQNLQELIQII